MKFQNSLVNRPTFSNTLFKTLSDQDVSLLDAPFTNEEIKEAVWNCGGGMSPGPPDGFTFKLIKHYWEIIGSEFIEMVKQFEIEGFLPRGSNSSFTALAPKCEDLLHIKDFRHITMEALHVTLEDAKLKNVFEGVKVGSNNIDISYLQFANDALIM
ncbi:hypothetical protein Tco_0612975 [Tanacetum coccineum]